MRKMLLSIFIEQFERGIVSVSGNNILIFNSDNIDDNDSIPWEYRQ